MSSASFSAIVTQLTDGQTPPVWSLLVTVFGELAQEDGAQISGQMLRHISELIGIKPEAMRVALHRLRKDGWTQNQRTGRTSSYSLTDWGRAQSAAASPRIYAPCATAGSAWLVLCDPARPTQQDETAGVWLNANTQITSQLPQHPDRFATLLDAGTPLPDWMKAGVCSPQTREAAAAFHKTLTALQDRLSRHGTLAPLEQATLRILLVHTWRRIILKTPDLPDFVFPDNWRGPACRAQMVALLALFPKPDLAALAHSIDA
ncbi:PaaX family transcriptional regulator C-terminal domain-containing protein [Sulfitobacter sp. HNIBRBA2951]|uniref:PaaX family transcriptional regulator C-terminal domain-containing protein n=1 Tax=Sulfitobacter aquimarinus TaxID=3158557 RepID=UPI0032E04D6B